MVYNVYKRATKLLIDDNLVIKYTCLLIRSYSFTEFNRFGNIWGEEDTQQQNS